ncbi:MAG TPA: GAF and ANTAR domain-containing protein [Microlunatus sp.]|nr:GAF and ANTAR domain-containing protein [Microlunatus sp.]
MALALHRHDDSAALLEAIVDAAVSIVPGAEGSSIRVLPGRHRPVSEAATSDLARRIEAIQDEVQQGPSLDAVHQQQPVRVDDVNADSRWPGFAARAAVTGTASVLALRLSVEGGNLGAVSLYSPIPGAFTDESERVGRLVADHAAVACDAVRKQESLALALAHRDLIGQAKGMIMERYQITGEQAFHMLSRVSQNTNRKLHEISRELVESGTLGGHHGLPPRPH